MHKGMPVLLVLLTASALVLAGCGGAATPTPAGGPPTQPPMAKLPEAATVAKPQPTSVLIGGATAVLGATVEPTPTPRPLPTRPPTPTKTPVPTDTAVPVATATEVPPTATLAAPTGPVEAPMVEIPAGEFLFGSDEQPEASPPQKVNLPAFSIDVYEVTNAQFAAFVAATGYQTTA
ncbi:MAG: SUMF1/EgtB/PvdO family nonheme iron enzyme, partial [Anaerolineae bacterium]